MSDLALLIIGLLVSFLCLGGLLIHVLIQDNVSDVGDVDDSKDERPAREKDERYP
ncbi:hypothetical protein [Pelagicoccus sp. SDUM812003]|uniref:hypothetical protein n=1 Tax=Pelagicoccus sp. SDUM812003 TaxID=3041267 RepID=UPI0028107AA2|nr:hypothetical protein [Pelagicoccus sp. SDUM812003]MDQ8201813.1 hypothetical protein [Pelagicoccus sp. SDUM812003]